MYSKKKIGLFLGVSPQMGGAYQYSLTLLKAVLSLPENQYIITVAYTDQIWEKFIPKKVNRIFILKTKWIYFWGIIITLLSVIIPFWRKIAILIDQNIKKIRNENCDLWIFSSYSFLCYEIPVPAVGIIQDLMHRYEPFPENSSFFIFYWRENVFKNMCKYCKAIFVESNMGKKHVLESYKTDSDKLYPLPLIPAEYIYSKDVPDDFDIRFPLPKKYIFYPAQFWEHKNHLRLLEALTNAKKTLKDICLVLVGSKKNAYAKVIEKVKLLGLEHNVIFLGYVPDEYMPELYRRARAMIYPTFFGSTNIPPLEALATGCPMAISKIYGMPEQAKDAALYFDPKSIEEITDSIVKLWTNDSLCCDLKNKTKHIGKNYSQNKLTERLLEIINTIIC